MFNKTTEIQMLTEIPRLITTALGVANMLWYSGARARRCHLQTEKKTFYRRHAAWANGGAAESARRRCARCC